MSGSSNFGEAGYEDLQLLTSTLREDPAFVLQP